MPRTANSQLQSYHYLNNQTLNIDMSFGCSSKELKELLKAKKFKIQ